MTNAWSAPFGDEQLHSALRDVLKETLGVSGALVSTCDGILVAAEFADTAVVSAEVEAETVAAMAAATIGVGAQFANRLALGGGAGCVVQGDKGCVAVQRLGGDAVLVLFGNEGPNVARLHLAVRQAVPRIRAILAG